MRQYSGGGDGCSNTHDHRPRKGRQHRTGWTRWLHLDERLTYVETDRFSASTTIRKVWVSIPSGSELSCCSTTALLLARNLLMGAACEAQEAGLCFVHLLLAASFWADVRLRTCGLSPDFRSTVAVTCGVEDALRERDRIRYAQLG